MKLKSVPFCFPSDVLLHDISYVSPSLPLRRRAQPDRLPVGSRPTAPPTPRPVREGDHWLFTRQTFRPPASVQPGGRRPLPLVLVLLRLPRRPFQHQRTPWQALVIVGTALNPPPRGRSNARCVSGWGLGGGACVCVCVCLLYMYVIIIMCICDIFLCFLRLLLVPFCQS